MNITHLAITLAISNVFTLLTLILTNNRLTTINKNHEILASHQQHLTHKVNIALLQSSAVYDTLNPEEYHD